MKPGDLPEGQPETVVRLDQFGGVVNEDVAEHNRYFCAHEHRKRVAVLQDQFFAAFHGLRERAVVKHQVLSFPVFVADQFVEIGSFGTCVHHDVSPSSRVLVLLNGGTPEKVEGSIFAVTTRFKPRKIRARQMKQV
jgi:hypothetical protein